MNYIPELENLSILKKGFEENDAFKSFFRYIEMLKRYRFYMNDLSVISIIKESNKQAYETKTIYYSPYYEAGNTLKETSNTLYLNFIHNYNCDDPNYIDEANIKAYIDFINNEKNWKKPFPDFIKKLLMGESSSLPVLDNLKLDILFNYCLQECSVAGLLVLNNLDKNYLKENKLDVINKIVFSDNVVFLKDLCVNNLLSEKDVMSYFNLVNESIYCDDILVQKAKLNYSIKDSIKNREINKI